MARRRLAQRSRAFASQSPAPSLARAVSALRARRGFVAPRVGVVLGSGLGAFADALVGRVEVPFVRIPGFAPASVDGHAGAVVLGRSRTGVPMAVLSGRVHLYEGRSPAQVVFPVRVLAGLGARALIITNAAGGIHPSLEPGDLMLITDQLNLTAHNPLVGPNDAALGPRFPDMTAAYDPALRALARSVAPPGALKEGVYAGLLGPTYETPSEVRMLRALGADAVGMSTVLEVIAARHQGVRVLGISCITNKAAGLSSRPLSHDEVKEVGARAGTTLAELLLAVVDACA